MVKITGLKGVFEINYLVEEPCSDGSGHRLVSKREYYHFNHIEKPKKKKKKKRKE